VTHIVLLSRYLSSPPVRPLKLLCRAFGSEGVSGRFASLFQVREARTFLAWCA